MPAKPKADPHLEIAHVLFIDVVGYSKLLVNEQRELVQQLNQVVRKTPQFRKSETAGKLIRIPIPPLTEERRKEYVRLVRHKAEEARVAIRNVRRDELHRVDAMQKQGELPEDDAKRAHGRLQKLTETHVERVDSLAARKEAEVMEV